MSGEPKRKIWMRIILIILMLSMILPGLILVIVNIIGN